MFENLVKDVSARTGLNEEGATELLRATTARLLHNEEGGLAPLLAALRGRGYTQILAHWLSDDPKAGLIDANDAETMLGSGFVRDAARAAGTDEETARRGVAVALPGLVHEMTPGGMIPATDDLEESYGGWAGGRVVLNAPKLGDPPVGGFPNEPAPVDVELAHPIGYVRPRNPDGIATLLPWLALFVLLPILTAFTCNLKPEANTEADAHGPAVTSEGAAHNVFPGE